MSGWCTAKQLMDKKSGIVAKMSTVYYIIMLCNK